MNLGAGSWLAMFGLVAVRLPGDTTDDAEHRVLVEVHSRPDGVTLRGSVAHQGETACGAPGTDSITLRGTVAGQAETVRTGFTHILEST